MPPPRIRAPPGLPGLSMIASAGDAAAAAARRKTIENCMAMFVWRRVLTEWVVRDRSRENERATSTSEYAEMSLGETD